MVFGEIRRAFPLGWRGDAAVLALAAVGLAPACTGSIAVAAGGQGGGSISETASSGSDANGGAAGVSGATSSAASTSSAGGASGGGASTSSASTSGGGGASTSSSASTSGSASASSSASSGGPACTADTDCPPDDFCRLGACVRLTAVTAGTYHACALTTAGAVQCWGSNLFGELGNNATTDSHVPVAVVGLSSGVAAITAGTSYTCALTTTGGVLCWGVNIGGQLGNGSTKDSHVPVPVTGLSSGVAAIAAGDDHACALTTAGGVLCWGSNAFHKLGNNTPTWSLVPVPVMELSSGVAAISAGAFDSCAVTTAGGAVCWGGNVSGVLGNNSTVLDSPVPVAVSGLSSGVTGVAVGRKHACARTAVGGVLCWGSGAHGALGDDATMDSPVPVPVVGLSSGVAAVAAGDYHACALTTAGAVQCWGAGISGALGNDSMMDSLVPVPVVGLSSGVAAIAAGESYSCALAMGRAQCWGRNDRGELGDGSTTPASQVPVTVIEP